MENGNMMIDIVEPSGAEEVRSPETIASDIKASLRTLHMVLLDGVIHIGNCLIEAKELLPHGEWGYWLENNINFSDRSARSYMRIAREFGEYTGTSAASKISFTDAMRMIQLPSADKKEIVSAIESGDVEAEDIKGTVDEYKERLKQLEDENADLQIRIDEIEGYAPSDTEIEDLKKRAEEAEKEIREKEKELQTQRGKVFDAEQKLKDAKGKADKAAQKKIDKAVEDAKKELEEKAASASADELASLKTALEDAKKRAEEAEKKAALAQSADKAELSVILKDIPAKVMAAITIIDKADAEDAQKYRAAFLQMLSDMADRVGGNN